MQPSVSVIVVTYNAAGTIARCIDSILGQSLKDIELIVIDDGSKDGTGGIVDRYMEADSRIKVVHQKNSGVSVARQKGLDMVTGAYSIFVDSDDWIEPDMLENLYGKGVEDTADMVFCDYVEENGLGTFYRKQEPVSTDSKVVSSQMLADLHGSLCTKLIKTGLYKESGLRFIEGLNYCEDECMVLRLLNHGCRISYVGKAFYHYDKTANASSVSNLWAARPAAEYELFIDSCRPYLNTPVLQKNMDERIAAIIKKLTYAPKEDYEACRAFYRRHKDALKQSGMGVSKKLFCALYFRGFRFLAGWREVLQSKH